MPTKRSPDEIISKLREIEMALANGLSTAEACRRIPVSEHTYYRWRKEQEQVTTDQARRIKELEKENQQLRRAICQMNFDNRTWKRRRSG